MKRTIPKWIGRVPIPDNRETLVQLIECWGDQVGITLPFDLQYLADRVSTYEFLQAVRELIFILLKEMKDKNMKARNTESIYCGAGPETSILEYSRHIAGILHNYFEPGGVKGVIAKPVEMKDFKEVWDYDS